MDYDCLDLRKHKNMMTLYLKNPETKNALTYHLMREIEAACSEAEEDPDIRGLIITSGQENVFSSGLYVKEVSAMKLEDFIKFIEHGGKFISFIRNFPKPILALINGAAIGGGCTLAMACDFRISSEDAYFVFPELNIGGIPAWGTIQLLASLVGPSQAKRILFTGKKITATEALNLGLVDKVVPRDDILPTAYGLMEEIIDKSPLALMLTKKIINKIALEDESKLKDWETSGCSLMFTTNNFQKNVKNF